MAFVLCLPSAASAAGLTGRQLVLFERAQAAQSSSLVRAVLARAGVERAGGGVPRLGIATVEGSRSELAALRRDPTVARVVPEYRRDLRRVPNDPSLSITESAAGTPAGTKLQWMYERQNFPAAWDIATGQNALVGVIDTGLDGNHPQLGPKVASALSFGTGSSPVVDNEGHGSHVSGLACAVTDDGVGTAGAGWGCRIVVSKAPELRDEDIIAGIVSATDRGAHAINMSFGGGGDSPGIDRAIDYAYQRNVVLVSAGSNDSTAESGSPASQLQPGNAPDLNAGRGLVVTGANFSDANAGTAFGPQVSMAAYGFFDAVNGPPGVPSTYTGQLTFRELPPVLCGCRFSIGGDNRYAYLQGTSMATPQVTAVAAMMRALNPWLGAASTIRILKETARGPGGWTAALGWGILDAGRALDTARRFDGLAPTARARASKKLTLPKVVKGRKKPSSKLSLKWSGTDPKGAEGLIPSGVASYDVFVRKPDRRSYKRLKSATKKLSFKYKISVPGNYRFYALARDRAGNLETVPSKPDVKVVVKRKK